MAFEALQIVSRTVRSVADVSYVIRRQRRTGSRSIIFTFSQAVIRKAGVKAMNPVPVGWQVDRGAGELRMIVKLQGERVVKPCGSGNRWMAQFTYAGEITELIPEVNRMTALNLIEVSGAGITIDLPKKEASE